MKKELFKSSYKRYLLGILLTLSFLVGANWSAWSQTFIIGDGTMTTDGSGTNDPVDRYFEYNRYQTVYLASELTAGGMVAGDFLDGLGWSISEGGFGLANYTISIGHTTAVDASSHITSGDISIVKDPFTYNTVVQSPGSFQMITFDNNFQWNGTDNILIEICNGFNTFTSPYGGLRGDNMSNGSRFVRSSSTSQCSTSTSTTNGYRPQVQFSFFPNVSCTGTPLTPTITLNPAIGNMGSTFIATVTGGSVENDLTYLVLDLSIK